MHIESLLPALGRISVRHLRITPTSVEVEVHGTAPSATCPICGTPSRRVHSRYVRTVHDLPWRGTPVTLRCRTRRLFCDNLDCPRRLFAEQMPDLAGPRGRSTPRRDGALLAIGLEAGGEPGKRLGRQLGIIASGDTLLRRLRASAVPDAPIPTVIGIDDFALRRGRRYGTIVVDHASRRVIDLLPERSSDVAAAWLRRHASVALVMRDRSGPYAKAVTEALPVPCRSPTAGTCA